MKDRRHNASLPGLAVVYLLAHFLAVTIWAQPNSTASYDFNHLSSSLASENTIPADATNLDSDSLDWTAWASHSTAAPNFRSIPLHPIFRSQSNVALACIGLYVRAP